MPRFAANISTMFTDRPFVERIQAAAASGFNAVECQFPYEVGADELEARLDHTGLDLVLLNTPAGDFAAGERGLAGLLPPVHAGSTAADLQDAICVRSISWRDRGLMLALPVR